MSRVKEFTYLESYPKQVTVANQHLDAMSKGMTIDHKADLLANTRKRIPFLETVNVNTLLQYFIDNGTELKPLHTQWFRPEGIVLSASDEENDPGILKIRFNVGFKNERFDHLLDTIYPEEKKNEVQEKRRWFQWGRKDSADKRKKKQDEPRLVMNGKDPGDIKAYLRDHLEFNQLFRVEWLANGEAVVRTVMACFMPELFVLPKILIDETEQIIGMYLEKKHQVTQVQDAGLTLNPLILGYEEFFDPKDVLDALEPINVHPWIDTRNWSHEDMFLLDKEGNFVDFALPCYLVAEE